MWVEHAHQREVVAVEHGLLEQSRLELLEDDRPSLAQGARRGLGRIPLRGEAVAELLEGCLLVLLRGRHRHTPDLCPLHDVDDAPVGNLRDAQSREIRERRVVVE